MQDALCPGTGTVTPAPCPAGRSNPQGSSASACSDCDYDNYYLDTAAGTCVKRANGLCDPLTQYEVPDPQNRTRERTCRALTVCNTVRLAATSPVQGSPAGIPFIEPLQQYISVPSTRYTDRECWTWSPCGMDDYVEQLPLDDGMGYLVQPLVCKPLTRESIHGAQYLLVDGSATRDRDNVWVDCTNCYADKPNTYQASPCTPTSDAVCVPYTECDVRYQYLQRKGDFDHDNVCALRTKCTAQSARSQYEVRAPVDSTDFSVNGTDAVCANYSTCAEGTYMSFPGDDTHDVGCTPCPAGTYRNSALFREMDGGIDANSVSCRECPRGTYSASPGATRCTPCTDCANASNLEPCPFAPASAHCTAAASAACTRTSDATCVACPSVPTGSGGFDLVDGVCVPCRAGYYYNASEPAWGKRCVPCTAGFYCPSKDEYIECPSVLTFMDPATKAYVTVPESPAGSYSVDQCDCTLAGGFVASSFSLSLFGCIACPDGYYSPPSGNAANRTASSQPPKATAIEMTQGECLPCPQGTYAAQIKSVRNYRTCPSKDSPLPVFGQVGNSSSGGNRTAVKSSDADCKASDMARARGASSCTACPPDRPYTWHPHASTASECKRCPQEHYYDSAAKRCKACASKCAPPFMYEAEPCTETSDRVCRACRYDACDPAAEYVDYENGCPGPVHEDSACVPCTNKPEHSHYIPPPQPNSTVCTWRCDAGYFSRAGDDDMDVCHPCTALTWENCKPGFVMTPCSLQGKYDASCSQACDPEEHGKPQGLVANAGGESETSEWVWTTYDARGDIVLNPTGGYDGLPNVGCMWRCKDGYRLKVVDAGGGTSVPQEGQTVEEQLALTEFTRIQKIYFCVDEAA